MRISFTKEEFQNVINDGKVVAREKHHRHNIENVTIVFPMNGSFYETQYSVTYDDGIDWEKSYECVEVEEVEVITKEWKAKP